MVREFQRNTRQRTVILEELCKVTSHPRAIDVYEMVRRQLPKISLGTVYRNLDLLSEMGMIQKLTMGGSEARFDGNPRPHYHIRCIECERVDDVHDLSAEIVAEVPATVNGYAVLGHRLEFVGVCSECQQEPVPR